MTELLIRHEKIENNESLNPAELKALQAINSFFDKNSDTDHRLKDDLEKKASTIPEDISQAYKTLKNDISFADAYPEAKYQSQRAKVIDYLANNFWRLKQEVGGKYFSTIPADLIDAKVADLNKTGKYDVIDIGKFRTNFQAEKIQNMRIQTVDTAYPELENYYKDQEHVIGKIFEVPAEEKAHIQDLVKYIQDDHSFILSIFGQADGTPVQNPQFIGKKYNELRDMLMQGCDKTIQSNINKIFPPFDTSNYPDKSSWNIAFAQARALSKISYLSAEDKNKLFAGAYVASSSGEHKLWNTMWNFKTVQETGHQYTKGSVEIEQSLDKVAKEIVEQRKNYIQNIGLNAIWFTISGTPSYQWQEIATGLKTDGLVTADFYFNKQSARKNPQQGKKFIPDFWLDQTMQAVYDKSSDRTIHVVVPYPAIKAGEYDTFFSYEKKPDGEIANIQLKPISFKDALNLFKKLNPEQSAQKYADNVEASLNNFDILTAALKDNRDLQIAVAKQIIETRKFLTPDTIKWDLYKTSKEYKILQEMGVHTQQSSITSKEGVATGKNMITFYTTSDSGEKIIISSKSL